MMMPFSTGLGWSVLGSRAGDRTAAGLDCRLWMWHSSAKTRKKGGRWGLRPWPLRCLSQFIIERKDRLLRGRVFFCVYLSPRGWPDIYSVCFPNWMVISILSYLMGYFLSLSISDLIRDMEGTVC